MAIDTQRAVGGGGGRGREWVLDEMWMMSQKLHLIGLCQVAASAIGSHHSYEILLPRSLFAEQL
jgi:hypothetical protein